ncbi:EF-hand calcium-binding domain-containing protein 1 [Terramyces sp. JEL0728]|nr:EF-hand calcium-binding domain-containing protein 1 [Terramyces sp. JEL0728]
MAGRLPVEDIIKITNCNQALMLVARPEVETLNRYFSSLAGANDKIDRSRFRDMLADIFGVDDSLIMDRGMSVFLKGRYEEKLKFCFRVYDLNGDRYISKEEMFQMLKNCLVKEAVEEDEDGVKDLVDLVLKKLDEDRDGRVSEADWSGAIAKEALLMEAFGQCLPPTKVVQQYMNPSQDDIIASAKQNPKPKVLSVKH